MGAGTVKSVLLYFFMSIITLISDFGTKDYAVATVKAALLKNLEPVTVVDISHEVSPYNIVETAFLLNAVYREFPEKTIHIIGVDAEYSKNQKHLAVSLENHVFIGADNGIFSLLQPLGKIQKIIALHHPKSEDSIFPVKDVFTDVALKILQNTSLDQLGKPIKTVKEWVKINPDTSIPNQLTGHVAYVDRYGNLITDISKKFFHQFRKNRNFEIQASSAKINRIYAKYDDFSETDMPKTGFKTKAGMALAVFNSLDLLEIALYKSDTNQGGSATELLGLKVGDSIKIRFE